MNKTDLETPLMIPVVLFTRKELATKKETEIFTLNMTADGLFDDLCTIADMRLDPCFKPDPKDEFIGAHIGSWVGGSSDDATHRVGLDKGEGTESTKLLSLFSPGWGPPVLFPSLLSVAPGSRICWSVEGMFPGDPPYEVTVSMRIDTYWKSTYWKRAEVLKAHKGGPDET